MEFQLVVIRGRSASTAIKLQDGVTNAGRQEDCQLRIKSSQVSRKHCQLFEKHGMLLVKDLGSSNGTYVNGQKVDGQRVMEPGDELGIGPIVFRVEKIGQPAPSRPAEVAGKPSDTAVAEAIAVADADALPADEEFEIDFDDEPAPAKAVASAAVTEDFEAIPVDDDVIVVDEAVVADDDVLDFMVDDQPAPAPAAKKPTPPAAAANPAPAKPAPAKAKEPEPAPVKDEPGLADDAVADFLLGIKVDDD